MYNNTHYMQVVYDLTWRETKAEPDSTGHSDHASPGAKAAQPNLPAMTSGQAACGETRSVLSASEALAPATSTYPIAALSHNSQRGVSALQNGGVIALPTDTLYGLAADAASSAGIQHIYSIKQRQAYAPLAICVADVTDLQRYCHADHLPEQLLQQLLPGPVTLILKQRQDAPLCDELNPGLATIGESQQLTARKFAVSYTRLHVFSSPGIISAGHQLLLLTLVLHVGSIQQML